MFCSHCGKSIRPEDAACPHCGAVLGEDRFLGNMYTSSQVRVPADAPESAPAGSLSAYTRTSYMSDESQPEGDVYSNTTYRPVLSEDEELDAPEDAPEQEARDGGEDDSAPEDAAAEEAAETVDGVEEEPAEEAAPDEDVEDDEDGEPVDLPDAEEADEDENVTPLPEITPRGISDNVRRYMEQAQKRAARQSERAAKKKLFSFGRRQKNAEEDDYVEETPADDVVEYDEDRDEDQVPAADEAVDTQEEGGYEPDPVEEDEVPSDDNAQEDDAEEDAEDEDDDVPSGKRIDLKQIVDTLKTNRTLQIAIGSVLAVIIIAAGIRWLLYVTSNLGVKIAGVTHSTYSDGIKLVDEYTSTAYRDKMVNVASVNPDHAQRLMDEDMAKITALMPQEPQENDKTFVDTLSVVYEGVQNVIKADGNAIYTDTVADRATDSAKEWAAVQSAANRLKNATNVTELSAVSSDVRAAVIPTPAPTEPPAPTQPTSTPQPVATALTQGMKDNDEVERMQRRLIELGYLAGGADGDFGPNTAKALKAFQEQAGLTADGIATEAVLDVLYADDAPAAPAAGTGEQSNATTSGGATVNI